MWTDQSTLKQTEISLHMKNYLIHSSIYKGNSGIAQRNHRAGFHMFVPVTLHEILNEGASNEVARIGGLQTYVLVDRSASHRYSQHFDRLQTHKTGN